METKKIDGPKNSSLHVVNLDSAERLDTWVAQPLLAGNPPEAVPPTTSSTSLLGNIGKPNPATPLIANGISLEDFPPLEIGRTRKIRANFEAGAPHDASASTWPRAKPKDQGCRDMPIPDVPNEAAPSASCPEKVVETPRDNDEPMADGDQCGEQPGEASGNPQATAAENNNKNPNNNNHRRGNGDAARKGDKLMSMADMVRETTTRDGPQAFDPEKLQNIGYASMSNGVQTIYFSGAEIQKLATNLGHAIVGKFSHSIPASQQIQKALDNIKFCRGYTWKYINAKHILVQFEDIADYARLLSGPKGTPVWFIDRHPMRVFKWTPDFDAYCESPIAAIWCNLIGLPIHLFDQSALFAIGKLLGTPIQVDRATANKSRLSFARICIEIDITKPPPEEIILDICGRETVQQVKWDKIPSYCRECKHVGHKSDVCYAAGKAERPPKRNYNNVPPKQPQHGGHGAKKTSGDLNQHDGNGEWKHQGKGKTKESNPRTNAKANECNGPEWEGPDFMGEMQSEGGLNMVIHSDKVEGTDRSPKQHRGPITRSSSLGSGRGGTSKGLNTARRDTASTSGDLVRPKGSFKPFDLKRAETQELESHMSTNRYFSLMARENYEENDWADKEDLEENISPNEENGGANPTLMEADTSREGNELQRKELHGGTSNPPGTDLSR